MSAPRTAPEARAAGRTFYTPYDARELADLPEVFQWRTHDCGHEGVATYTAVKAENRVNVRYGNGIEDGWTYGEHYHNIVKAYLASPGVDPMDPDAYPVIARWENGTRPQRMAMSMLATVAAAAERARGAS